MLCEISSARPSFEVTAEVFKSFENGRDAFRWSWLARERRQAKEGVPASQCRLESLPYYRQNSRSIVGQADSPKQADHYAQ